MPSQIHQKITYLYAADGRKLSETITDGQMTHTFDYCGNMVYEDGLLSYILNPAGRALPTGQAHEYSYEYFLHDHLGNVRVVFGDPDRDHEAEVIQENHYYPFGMTMAGLDYSAGLENRYLYQGKERTGDFNLWWSDFHARRFDSQLGRWHVPDPAGQFASAYVGMGNNPVSLTDLDGMWAVGTYGGYSRMLAAVGRELALMYQDYYDWIDMFSARYGNMGNVAIWHFSVGGSGGNAALSFTTESGSMISTKPEYWNESASEAQGLFYNRRKGEIGNYYQTSGSIRYYINEQGQTVNVLTSEVIAKWVAYGGATPEWNDVGWRGLNAADGGGKLEPLYGWSIDVTIAAAAGYTVEFGEIYDPNTGKTQQFFSNGPAFGVEATAGINAIIIFPKDNFKFSDLEGTSWGVSVGYGISISVSGNSTPGYNGGTQFDSYFMIKIGFGPGAGFTNTPENNTDFIDLIPSSFWLY